ncbi:epididymal sperm-binding protein 1-like [Lacerta agilis]|uniref:epididymal sperm-binding protein 1-like n=1 Tax=Lacerta agilis TaxID=80427 RepID=UPI001419F5B8|nr:epididymal sperm-binding protein 1-like [Lacerta agilis]
MPEIGDPCVYPFKFNNKFYSSCTNDFFGYLWCATEVDTTTKNVKSIKKCKTKEYGGNDDLRRCLFPFVYKGQTFYTCTMKDTKYKKEFWCATTKNYDQDGMFRYCPDTVGIPCVFPFIYKDKSYSTCTKENHDDLWCATKVEPDTKEMTEWKLCMPKESGGSAFGRACVFPFVYKGQTFDTCTTQDSPDGDFWCATTGNYDQDEKWSYCPDTEYGGNDDGKPCVFPFVYKGQSYDTCTSYFGPEGDFWCATTGNYDQDEKWTYCPDTVFSPRLPEIIDQRDQGSFNPMLRPESRLEFNQVVAINIQVSSLDHNKWMGKRKIIWFTDQKPC